MAKEWDGLGPTPRVAAWIAENQEPVEVSPEGVQRALEAMRRGSRARLRRQAVEFLRPALSTALQAPEWMDLPTRPGGSHRRCLLCGQEKEQGHLPVCLRKMPAHLMEALFGRGDGADLRAAVQAECAALRATPNPPTASPDEQAQNSLEMHRSVVSYIKKRNPELYRAALAAFVETRASTPEPH